MKYVILIHSNPEPWGHPTTSYTAEGRQLPAAQREKMDRDWEALMTELKASGEFLGGEALGDPAHARLYTAGPTGAVTTDGPYAESKEHLAGVFLFNFATQQRAEEVAAQFISPGDTAELRSLL